MALKAGYVGVKRFIYEKLLKNVADNKTIIDGIGDNMRATGAVNLFPIKLSTLKPLNTGGTWEDNVYTYHDIVFTCTVNSAGYVTQIATSGTASTSNGAYLFILSGVPDFLESDVDYFLSGCPTGGSTATYMIQYSNWTEGASYDKQDRGDGVVIRKITDSTTQKMRIWLKNGVSGTNLVFKPMIILASYKDTDFIPYAMTNQQLTAEAATLEGVDDAHKTVINGIISAATGAADFAAFKTAMAALTPLTRSAAPDTREASPEVIEDEPDPVTKTTRSTKKTATTKEGE